MSLFLHYQTLHDLFEIECDAYNMDIGIILMQEGHPIVYLVKS